MKWRVSQSVGERGQKVQLSTFHAFCSTILSELEPATRVLDQVDHWILLRRNLRLLQLDRFRRLSEPGQFLGDFVKFFSRCQDELVTPDAYQEYADRLTAQARRALAPGSTLEQMPRICWPKKRRANKKSRAPIALANNCCAKDACSHSVR